MDEFSNYFRARFPDFYSDVYRQFSEDEPMPDLSIDKIEEICSVFHSCTYLINESADELVKVSMASSYISIMIATRQILENGNKRLSFLVLYTYLIFAEYELNIEHAFYSQFITKCIEELDSSSPKESKEKRDVLINSFAEELKNYIRKIASNNLLDESAESKKNLLDKCLQFFGIVK